VNKLLAAKEKAKYSFLQNQALKNSSAPEALREPRLSAKRRRKPAVSRENLLFCGLIVCLIITSIVLINQYSRVLAVNYQIQQVGREISQLKEEQQHLLIEVKRLGSLERIEQIARNDLGLQYPEKTQWLVVSARGN
jgi:cell division protein FtsL